jgi:hypothetical protein
MVYDGQPIHDHFKVIDSNAVMGIMNGKKVLDDGRYFYFYLERASGPSNLRPRLRFGYEHDPVCNFYDG